MKLHELMKFMCSKDANLTVCLIANTVISVEIHLLQEHMSKRLSRTTDYVKSLDLFLPHSQ